MAQVNADGRGKNETIVNRQSKIVNDKVFCILCPVIASTFDCAQHKLRDEAIS